MEDEILNPILTEVLDRLREAQNYVFEYSPRSPFAYRLNETVAKVGAIKSELAKGNAPNWYVLYEGLCQSHIELKAKYHSVQRENERLRKEIKDIYEKFYDVTDRLNKKLFGVIEYDEN